MFGRRVLIAFLCLCICAGFQSASANLITNGTFDTDTTGWTVLGKVTRDGSVAKMSDEGGGYGLLYQPVDVSPVIPGYYTLEFDIMAEPSLNVPDFSFPDTFWATLYFVNDLVDFDLTQAPPADDSLSLIDIDTIGFFPWGGTVSPGPQDGWQHYKLTFYNQYNYVIPTFELFDDNNATGDSFIFLDNIQLYATPIPEPGTTVLISAGLLVYTGLVRRKRRGLPV